MDRAICDVYFADDFSPLTRAPPGKDDSVLEDGQRPPLGSVDGCPFYRNFLLLSRPNHIRNKDPTT